MSFKEESGICPLSFYFKLKSKVCVCICGDISPLSKESAKGEQLDMAFSHMDVNWHCQ
jgi:hypothetical protein